MEYVVVASRPGSPANLRAVLSSDLQPVSFRAFSPRGGRGPGKGERGKRPDRQRPDGERPDRGGPDRDGRGPGGPIKPVDLTSQLALYAGSDAPRYRQTAFAIPTPDGLLSAWEWGEMDQPGLLARLQVYVRRGGIVRADHELQVAAPVIAARVAQYELQQSLANPGRSLFVFFTISVACWYFFRSMATSFVPLRFALSNLPIVAIPLLADFLLGPDYDRIVITAFRNNSTLLAQLSASAALLAVALGAVALMVTAGRSILTVDERPRWLDAQRIYLRQLTARPSGFGNPRRSRRGARNRRGALSCPGRFRPPRPCRLLLRNAAVPLRRAPLGFGARGIGALDIHRRFRPHPAMDNAIEPASHGWRRRIGLVRNRGGHPFRRPAAGQQAAGNRRFRSPVPCHVAHLPPTRIAGRMDWQVSAALPPPWPWHTSIAA